MNSKCDFNLGRLSVTNYMIENATRVTTLVMVVATSAISPRSESFSSNSNQPIRMCKTNVLLRLHVSEW
jgi:hypothetical protein